MDLQDGWQLIDQDLRLDYFATDRSVWLATRAWEMRRNHILANDIEFRLNGQKLTPTAEFITSVMPRWKTFIVDSMQSIDVQGLVVFTMLRLEGGFRAPKVLPPETYRLYVRHNVNTVADEYKVTRILPGGIMQQSGADVTGIKPITWHIGQTRPDFSQDFPDPDENDNTVYVMGGFGFDPLTTGEMTSRVSRYYAAWKKYQLYQDLHMAHIESQVRPKFYVKMTAVPEHVTNHAIFTETTAQLGNLQQNSDRSRDKQHQERVQNQYKQVQRMIDDANRRDGLLVPEDPEDVLRGENLKAISAYFANHNLIPLPPGTDLVRETRPTPQFDLAEARSEITAHISSAYGTTPALWEQTSTMKGNVELFESVLVSTMTASIKMTMEAISQIFNQVYIGPTHSTAILANYDRYMRPEMEKILLEKLNAREDHREDRSVASVLPFHMRAAQTEEKVYGADYLDANYPSGSESDYYTDSDSELDRKRGSESDSESEDEDGFVETLLMRKKKKKATGKRKRRGGQGKKKKAKTLAGDDFKKDTLSDNVRYTDGSTGSGNGKGLEDDEEIPSTMAQLREFAETELAMSEQVDMFVEKVPERRSWVEEQLQSVKERAARAYYTLTITPYGSRQTNQEILATFLGGSMTAEEVIQKTRNNSSLHQEDMSQEEFDRAVQYLEKLKAASAKEFMAAQYAKMMQESGVSAAAGPNASANAKSKEQKSKPKTKEEKEKPKAKKGQTDTDKAKQAQRGTGTSKTDSQTKKSAEERDARKETNKSSDTKKADKQAETKKRQKRTAS